ncbi:MAG TPA: DUF3105 domain-containing protein [Anaerolineales bacterium]
MKSKRKMVQARRRRNALITRLALGGLALIAVALIASSLLREPAPELGGSVPIMPDTSHVAESTDPGPYNSDPPTSGKHYEATLNAGFYNEGDVTVTYPAGNLVHNLEHGYVIFWYNCSLVSETECTELKEQIQNVMADENDFKVIAFPWPTIDVPVVMTSWGWMLRMESFDPQVAQDFVQNRRNKSPEPGAP